GSIVVNPFENLMFGASYTSNLAGSDSFNEAVVDPDNLDSLVGGWSAFVSFKFLGRFKLIGEYVGALDHFKAGEIYDAADPKERKPLAWNAELGVAITDNLELAARYDGSDDGGPDFLPESRYGAVLNWGFFKNTNLALEYLHGEFEGDVQEKDSFIAQLAVEF
ncbi:MAG: LbtU family siderophore porin, partial [Desulfobacterales bacterium]